MKTLMNKQQAASGGSRQMDGAITRNKKVSKLHKLMHRFSNKDNESKVLPPYDKYEGLEKPAIVRDGIAIIESTQRMNDIRRTEIDRIDDEINRAE